MDFQEAKAHAMGVLFDTDLFSEYVTYTPVGSSPVYDVPAGIVYGVSRDDSQKGDGNTWRLTAERDFRSNFNNGGTRSIITISIRASDVPVPEYGDTVEFDGMIWTVREVFDDA